MVREFADEHIDGCNHHSHRRIPPNAKKALSAEFSHCEPPWAGPSELDEFFTNFIPIAFCVGHSVGRHTVVEKNFDVSFLGGPLLSLQVPASHGDVAQERARVAGRPLFAQDSLVRGPGFDRGGRRALKQALPKGGLDLVLQDSDPGGQK